MKCSLAIWLGLCVAACSADTPSEKAPAQLTSTLEIDGEPMSLTGAAPAGAALYEPGHEEIRSWVSWKVKSSDSKVSLVASLVVEDPSHPFVSYNLDGNENVVTLLRDGIEYKSESGTLSLVPKYVSDGMISFEAALNLTASAGERSFPIKGRVNGVLAVACSVPGKPSTNAGAGGNQDGNMVQWTEDSALETEFCRSVFMLD
jgi:hypothetical protein